MANNLSKCGPWRLDFWTKTLTTMVCVAHAKVAVFYGCISVPKILWHRVCMQYFKKAMTSLEIPAYESERDNILCLHFLIIPRCGSLKLIFPLPAKDDTITENPCNIVSCTVWKARSATKVILVELLSQDFTAKLGACRLRAMNPSWLRMAIEKHSCHSLRSYLVWRHGTNARKTLLKIQTQVEDFFAFWVLQKGLKHWSMHKRLVATPFRLLSDWNLEPPWQRRATQAHAVRRPIRILGSKNLIQGF